jgi:hypothetical protein
VRVKGWRRFWNSNLRFPLSPQRLRALPERSRQIVALAFALHKHGTLGGEAMKLILDRSADVGCYWWSNARLIVHRACNKAYD